MEVPKEACQIHTELEPKNESLEFVYLEGGEGRAVTRSGHPEAERSLAYPGDWRSVNS